jgi:hypothetical protein
LRTETFFAEVAAVALIVPLTIPSEITTDITRERKALDASL